MVEELEKSVGEAPGWENVHRRNTRYPPTLTQGMESQSIQHGRPGLNDPTGMEKGR